HRSLDAPLLNEVRPDVPAELAALVARMMAKEPVRRFAEPAEVAEALSPFAKKPSARPDTADLGAGPDATWATPEPTRIGSDAIAATDLPLTLSTGPGSGPSRPEPSWSNLIKIEEPVGDTPAKLASVEKPDGPHTNRLRIAVAVAAGLGAILFG